MFVTDSASEWRGQRVGRYISLTPVFSGRNQVHNIGPRKGRKGRLFPAHHCGEHPEEARTASHPREVPSKQDTSMGPQPQPRVSKVPIII